MAAVAEREGCRGRKVRGTVWLVGFGVDRLAGCYGCEGAFCQDWLSLAGWISLLARLACLDMDMDMYIRGLTFPCSVRSSAGIRSILNECVARRKFESTVCRSALASFLCRSYRVHAMRHTQHLIRFAKPECQLILVHDLAVLLGSLRSHFDGEICSFKATLPRREEEKKKPCWKSFSTETFFLPGGDAL